jgi:hypothetical protein
MPLSMPLNAAQCRSMPLSTRDGHSRNSRKTMKELEIKILEASVGTLQEDKAAAQRQI